MEDVGLHRNARVQANDLRNRAVAQRRTAPAPPLDAALGRRPQLSGGGAQQLSEHRTQTPLFRGHARGERSRGVLHRISTALSTRDSPLSTTCATIGSHTVMFQIGPSLREARTRRGLSPADVHKAVRIRERYLTALEEERWDMLPGDAYTKGFLRTYAEFLGLNGQLYIDEFNARIAQHEDEPLVPDSLKRVGGASSILFRTIGAVLLVGGAI